MKQDVVFAIRQLVREPGSAAAAIFTLGLGLGTSLAVFTLVNAVLLRPLPFTEPERLMSIGRFYPGFTGNSSHRDVRFLREHVHNCSPIAASVRGSGMNVVLEGTVSHQEDRLVSRGYFEALGIAPAWGRSFTVDEDADQPPPVVILNERFLQRQRLDPAAIVGREIQLAGRGHTVVGVLAARHTRPSDAAIYRPLGADPRGGGQNLQVVCRLTAGGTAVSLETELAALTDAARQNRLIGDRTQRAYVAMPLHEFEFGAMRTPLMTLLVAVVLVLLVAAANTTGLLLVRAAGRRREIALRTALGASPRRIAIALVIEGLTLAAVSGAMGFALAPLFINGLLAVAPAYYVELATFDIDARVVAAAVVLCAVVGTAVSLPPLMELLRVNLRDTLQEEGARGTSGRRTVWMRQLLIGAETAVCAVLLVGALLLLRTFVNLMNAPTGFDPTGVITARTSVQGAKYDDVAQLIRFFEDGVARLEQVPSIEGVAVAASVPAERALNLAMDFVDTPNAGELVAMNWRYVTPQYFPLLRVRQIAGRPLQPSDRAGATAVAVVNETLAKQMYGGIAQALGRRIAIHQQPPREVVGVVGDTTGWGLGDTPRPMVFVPLAQLDAATARTAHAFFAPRWIVKSTQDPEGARRHLEAVVRELDPAQPFTEIRTLESLMMNSVSMQRFYLVVLTAFAMFAVLLAAVGVYASYSYLIASRQAEIGVRLALGAAPRRIVWGVVRQALILGVVAIAIGLAGAAAATRILESVLFNVTTTDPATYATVGVTLLATILLATLLPALRAARIDPLAALRA
jgi:predicted permease